MESTDHRWSDNEYREDPGNKVAVRHKMAGYGEERICEVRGEVKWGNNLSFEPGAVEFYGDVLGLYLFKVRETNGAAERFYFMPESSITATHDSLTFSEVSAPVLRHLPITLHLRGADQKQLQLFLDKLPDRIKVKYLREPTGANGRTRRTRIQEQKVALHEEPTREAQQLTSRQEQLQQKELGEAGLREQLREKENEKQNLERLSRETEQQLRGKDKEQQNLQRQLREKDEQQQNLQRQLREKDEQQHNLQRQFREMKTQLAHCQGQLRKSEKQETKFRGQLREKEQQLTILQGDKEKESAHLQQKLNAKLEELAELERELRNREQDIVDLQRDLSAAKETVSKYESQLRTRDWVLYRNEIQLTDNCLGAGGWGRVVKGWYCGCAVAIKQLHQPTLSSQERDLFEREMDIASRCRHPCLLQFIGATQDEKSPLFVTELMETSLRELLGKRHLSETEITVISLDIARALNYLHQRKPEPIVHRDVSSANVLLWKQNDQWRGKVSDYGTVRFLQEIMTKAPGNISYSAPEVGSPYNQTVKIDVYSFGVLLCEMCTGNLPVIENRVKQVKLITNEKFRDLIMWCIEEDPEKRPSMEEIIEKLEPAV